MAIYIILTYCITYFFNTYTVFFLTYYGFGWWSRFIACRCPKFSNILHFSNICQSEFVIIIFNVIALTLQMFSIWWTNLYLILKLLTLTSTRKSYDNGHLSHNHYFLLPSSLSYFPNRLLHLSHPFHSLHPSNLFHIVLSYFWNQRVQYHGVNIPGSFIL